MNVYRSIKNAAQMQHAQTILVHMDVDVKLVISKYQMIHFSVKIKASLR